MQTDQRGDSAPLSHVAASDGTSLSHAETAAPASVGAGNITLRLSYRPPMEIDTLFAFFARRALTGVEEVVNGHYRRTVAIGQARGIIDIAPLPNEHVLILRLQLAELHDLNLIVQRCRQIFDLDADPAAIAEVLGADPVLQPLVEARPGLRVPNAIDGFEATIRAILGQQISIAAARTLAGRLAIAAGQTLTEPQGSLTHYFPTPAALAEANLAGLGLTQGKINAIQALARAIAYDGLHLDRGADRVELQARLLALPGIGPWTVSYIAMRALGDPDAIPASDLGLRQAFQRLGLPSDPASIAQRAQAWRPWSSYAAIHLWESLSDRHEEK